MRPSIRATRGAITVQNHHAREWTGCQYTIYKKDEKRFGHHTEARSRPAKSRHHDRKHHVAPAWRHAGRHRCRRRPRQARGVYPRGTGSCTEGAPPPHGDVAQPQAPSISCAACARNHRLASSSAAVASLPPDAHSAGVHHRADRRRARQFRTGPPARHRPPCPWGAPVVSCCPARRGADSAGGGAPRRRHPPACHHRQHRCLAHYLMRPCAPSRPRLQLLRQPRPLAVDRAPRRLAHVRAPLLPDACPAARHSSHNTHARGHTREAPPVRPAGGGGRAPPAHVRTATSTHTRTVPYVASPPLAPHATHCTRIRSHAHAPRSSAAADGVGYLS